MRYRAYTCLIQMDRTVRTFKETVNIESAKWKTFRRQLRPDDRERLDKIFDYARMHADSGTMVSIPHRIDVVFMAVLIEMQRRIDEIGSNLQYHVIQELFGRFTIMMTHPSITRWASIRPLAWVLHQRGCTRNLYKTAAPELKFRAFMLMQLDPLTFLAIVILIAIAVSWKIQHEHGGQPACYIGYAIIITALVMLMLCYIGLFG